MKRVRLKHFIIIIIILLLQGFLVGTLHHQWTGLQDNQLYDLLKFMCNDCLFSVPLRRVEVSALKSRLSIFHEARPGYLLSIAHDEFL